MSVDRLARGAVAFTWTRQGLWKKVLGRDRAHLEIVKSVPLLDERQARRLLVALGIVETALAVAVVAGYKPKLVATAQTCLVIAMNGGGLMWGREEIDDPGAMIEHNAVLIAAAWLLARR